MATERLESLEQVRAFVEGRCLMDCKPEDLACAHTFAR